MPHSDFVHLRLHTAYSLSEGAIRVPELVKMTRAGGMPAVAMTDTNNLFGAMDFSGACAGAGIQPIIGCQLSVAVEEAEANGPRAGRLPSVVALAKNRHGYGNLMRMLKTAYLDVGEQADPHVPLAVLEADAEDLILFSGGAGGPVGRLLLAGKQDAAEALARRLLDAYGDRFYMEIQRHGTEDEAQTEPAFLEFAHQLGVPLVATNEAFFTTRDMYDAHDALICIAEGAYVVESDRRRLTPEHYLKSGEEMRKLFDDLPEAVDNTLVVARRCAFMVEKIKPILPPYDCGEGHNEETELRRMAAEGLEARLEAQVYTDDMDEAKREEVARPYRERLEYELGVIVQMGFPGYFLIVSEFIQWAKAHGIPVGPGRGSGAGSVAAWSLTITDLDPLRFGLLFERFLNPERVSMPDFDIDFCQDKRDRVIHHVQDKYGRDMVAQIITFGKLQARAVLRDVGRVLQMPYPQVDRISKLVPNNPAKPVTLEQAINVEPQLRQMIDDDPSVAELVNIAKRLEGLYRHASTHAAGVVIGDRPLQELIPLYRDPRSDMPVTGFNMKWVESAGLVKFDFLGLKTLTVLAKAVEFIGDGIDLSNLPLDDRSTYEMLGRGETSGVFQLESAGMRDVLKGLKPDSLEDIIAVVALYRPGPMDNIPSYIARKHGQEEPDYLYPTLEGILKETFGIMIYQEQVMQIAQELSGYTLGGADLLRRAMGKKIQAEMDKQRKIFVEGAVGRGVPKEKANDIFDQVNKFAGYGFNKSHAAAYALVAYQTAYLKANHPVAFMAATMTLDMQNTDKLAAFRQELDRLGIPLLPPDVNASGPDFKVEGHAVRYALAAIRNVGHAAMEAVVAEREKNGPFADLFDFADRIDPHMVNKRQLENLARAGAFDRLEKNRRRVYEGVESLVRQAAAAAEDRASNQINLFGGDTAKANRPNLPEIPDWPAMERLREEFEAIGFYLSAHPLDTYGKSLKRIGTRSFAELAAGNDPGPVALAGTVIAVRRRTSSRGNPYAFVQLSDTSGVFEVTVFSEILSSCGELLTVGNNVFLKVSPQREGDSLRLTAMSVDSLNTATAGAAEGLQVRVMTSDAMAATKALLDRQTRGKGAIRLLFGLDDGTEVTVALPHRVALSPAFIADLQSVPGIIGVEET